MSEHPWCRDVARDEAVRAAEDAATSERPALPDWRDIPQRLAVLEQEVAAMRAPVVPAAEAEAEVERLRSERDAAIRERDAALARVAELERRSTFLSQHKEAWAYETPLDGWEIGSREWAESEPELHWIKLSAPEETGNANGSKGGVGEVTRQPGAEPVAWATCCRDGSNHSVWCMREDADEEARQVGGTVVPLFRSPPPPRGWLTAEESVLIARIAHNTREDDPVSQGRPYFITVREAAVARALLSRDAPPKVRLPDYVCLVDSPLRYYRMREVWDALAAAGVEVSDE
jgi:hypothetical protein